MTTGDKKLSIILPSYNDKRIVRAIKSIKKFDDIDTVVILVIDGDSSIEVKEMTQNELRDTDVFLSEPDQGIFDALNKGLSKLSTPYAGWLGSDDLFTGNVKASDVVNALKGCDLFIADIDFFKDGYVTRKTHALPSRIGLMKVGLHNPHYATFGVSELLKSEKFRLDLRGSDIDYFLKIFDKKPRIISRNVVATYQAEGGYSNRDVTQILKINFEISSLFGVFGPIAIITKLSYKSLSKFFYKIFRHNIMDVLAEYDA